MRGTQSVRCHPNDDGLNLVASAGSVDLKGTDLTVASPDDVLPLPSGRCPFVPGMQRRVAVPRQAASASLVQREADKDESAFCDECLLLLARC